MNGPTADFLHTAPAHKARARLLDQGCRYVVALVFLMAAVTKITALEAFADHLVLHSELPPSFAQVVAAILPWLELTCGLCLLAGVAVREAAVILAVLLPAFTLHLLAHPVEADCACLLFPVRPQPAMAKFWSLSRNLLLLLGCFQVARARKAQAHC